MSASTGRAFPRLGQPGSLVKYETALLALGRHYQETLAGSTQRSADMFQVAIDIPSAILTSREMSRAETVSAARSIMIA